MSTNQLLYVKLFIRTSKQNPEMGMLYVRISVNSARVDFSFNQRINIEVWDSKKEVVKSKEPNFRKINQSITSAKSKIYSIFEKLRYEEKRITPLILKNHFLGITEDEKTLLSLIEYHNSSQETILSPGTMKNYYTTRKYVIKFLKQKKHVDDIFVKQLNYQFITEFEIFLRKHKPTDHQRPLSNNGVMKHLERLRKITTLGVKLEWLNKDPFERYKLSFKKVEKCFLSELEIEVIRSKKFNNERIKLCRDLFIFSCYTGLSYIDVKLLSPDKITIGIDGSTWIKTNRKKTGTVVNIPLLPIAQEIIDKYKNHPRAIHNKSLFPTMSNQKLNTYLKEIADVCGINKNLTFHIARHTFATTITLSNGVPIETVSKILGHTKLSTTQIYAKVLENKISTDMQNLKDKLSSNKMLKIKIANN